MNEKERKLLDWRLVTCALKYRAGEPDDIRIKLDNQFLAEFTVNVLERPDYLVQLAEDAIHDQNEYDLDLVITLAEHFEITRYIDEVLASLLIQPWHHFHDNIARILEFDHNEKTAEYLLQGATYTCDHLDYESDYCEFSRKCLYALLKIGTPKTLQYIRDVACCDHPIIANHAKTLIKKYGL